MKMRYYVGLIVIMVTIFGLGCVDNKPQSTEQPLQTIQATTTITIVTPMMTTIVSTPIKTIEIIKEDYDSIFKDKTFLSVSGQQIISGTVNGEYVNFVGKVFNVLPRHTNNIYGKDFVDFQVWGRPLSHEDPIYITLPIDYITGTIRDDISANIYGYVNKDWIEGKNTYGGPISQPLIFAINVTVIPENPD